MAAANTDYFTEVGNPGTATTLAAPGHLISGTSITVVSTSNWPTSTGVIFAIDTVSLVSGEEVRDVGSYTEWEGTVTSSTVISNLTLRYGTDQNYPSGSTTRVYIPVASSRENRLVQGLGVSLHQTGKVLNTAVIKDTNRDRIINNFSPPGMVAPYAGSSAPTDWLLCDGSAVSRTTYADLFTIISTTFGAGNGSTTFNVPDMRSRLPIGVGTGTYTLTFANTDVTTATDQIAVAASDENRTGRAVALSGTGVAPTGLAFATTYYMILVDSTHIKLATTEANALLNNPIDITAQGTGTNTLTGTLTARTLGAHGGSETHYTSFSKDAAYAQAAYTAGASGPLEIRAITANVAAWTTNISITTGSIGGGAGSKTRGISMGGLTDMNDGMNPFLGMNYIIKT